MNTPQTLVLVLAVLAPAGCLPVEQCERTDREVTGRVTTPELQQNLSGEVTISGTLDPTEVALTRIWVADPTGTQVAVGTAKAGTRNFEQWEAKVSASLFQTEPGADPVSLDVFVTDICGVDHLVDSYSGTTEPPDTTPVSDLSATLIYAGEDTCYVPVDGSGEADLQVQATTASVGGLVSLSASLVTFDPGALDANGKLRLVQGSNVAQAAVKVYASDAAKAGLSAIRASALGAQTQRVDLVVADPPSLVSGASTIPLGATATVFVSSRGVLDRCYALASEDTVSVIVESTGADLIEGPKAVGDKDCSDPVATDSERLDISFSGEPSDDAFVNVYCVDTYEQVSAGVTIGYEPPPDEMEPGDTGETG